MGTDHALEYAPKIRDAKHVFTEHVTKFIVFVERERTTEYLFDIVVYLLAIVFWSFSTHRS